MLSIYRKRLKTMKLERRILVGCNKLRKITLVLSLVLIASAFIIGCTPQERPTPERNEMRNDLGGGNGMRNDLGGANGMGNDLGARNNNLFDNGMGFNGNNRYQTRLDDYGPLDRRNGNDRLYGFFDTGNNQRGLGYDNIPQGMMPPSRTASNSQEVNRMENSCENIKGVTNATIVRNGDTAYVGCTTDEGTNENIAALRTECANRIRNIDPSVRKVVVTVDPNKISKMRNMVRDIDIGRPARGFMTDLENLFR